MIVAGLDGIVCPLSWGIERHSTETGRYHKRLCLRHMREQVLARRIDRAGSGHMSSEMRELQ
jgi:hypothetical protein